MYVAPAWKRFSLLRCGRVRRLDSRDRYAHVVAEYPAGELWGWMPESAEDGPDMGCNGPDRKVAPNDYRVAVSADEIGALEFRMKMGDDFYFVRGDDDRLECQRVTIARTILRTHEFWVQGNRVFVHADPLHPDESLSAYSAVGAYLRAVAMDGDSIGFVEFGWSIDSSQQEVQHYDPLAVRWWDKTMERCRERLSVLQARGDHGQN